MRLSISEAVENARQIPRRERAFTMVEVALSLAVMAFALVAIIGVLPTGMTVQKDNREDTVINQEGRFWIEAIKGSGRGVLDLTNYVEEITLTNRGGSGITFVNTLASPLTSQEIIALLSRIRQPVDTNRLTLARVKAITGPAAEKGSLTNEYSFRYQMSVDVIPALPLPASYALSNPTLNAYNQLVGYNLWDVRLVLRWPVVERGNGWYIGNNRKTFRARIAGHLEPVPTNGISPAVLKQGLTAIVPNKFNG